MLEPGETVLDLGSGGGLDVLLSARRVGPDGVAYGLDASTDMLSLARANTAQAGVLNARFLQGHVENIPLPDDHVDVIISNCVINLSVDKPRALAEAFRVLRSGVASASAMSSQTMESTPVSARMRSSKSAAWRHLTQIEYRDLLVAAGFADISVTLTHAAGAGLHSAIVQAVKPVARQT